ncbi:MAG: DUF2849 domain-containing protein [Nitratireductor sp.]
MKTITANRLKDGVVVWLTTSGWETSISRAAVLSASDAVDAGLETAARALANREVVEVAAIDVTLDENRQPVPVRLRERIRAFGPTITADPQIAQSLVA